MPDQAARTEVTNPGTGEVLGQLQLLTVDQVDAVIADASSGQAAMAAMPSHARADLLLAVAARMDDERESLATLLAAENGKPIEQTEGEVDAAIRIFRGSAAEATRLVGKQTPLDAVPGLERSLAVTIREPLGVVAAIVPFNYPVELYAHKAAGALAAGNAVVVQPPARCPLTLMRIHEIVQAVGAPRFAHQLVTGGVPVSQRLADHPGIAAISLTGSTVAGREIGRRGAATFKKVLLELGGNDALIVCADADVESAADAVVAGRLARGNGQICCAVKRIYVDAVVHNDFVEALLAKAAVLSVGDQLERSTEVGPLITASAAEAVDAAVKSLVADGARLALGGVQDGAFYTPAVLTDVPADSAALAEEIFGPVAPVARFTDPAEAVAMANASPFGLQAAVFTRNISRAFSLAAQLDVGGVVINGSTALRAENLPFGGTKESGGHREGYHHTVRDLTREKTMIVMEAFG